MASLDRAYGVRGAAIALAMAAVAGAVHGTFAQAFDVLWVKLLIGLAGSIVLIMAGVISARRSWWGTVSLALLMAGTFFVTRWSCWAVMQGGWAGLAALMTTPPQRWPEFLVVAGISAFWTVELIAMCIPAMFGCIAGHERAEAE